MKQQSLRLLAFFLLLSVTLPQWVMAADSSPTQAELDQMMAPVALYPDSLLSQILMASTYPDQVSEAAKWSKDNSDQKGDDAVKAVQDKAWDPSVASLVAFPQALSMMGEKPDWVEQMGDAFLASPDKVMDTVQGLRKKAKEAGNLESSKEQKVSVDDSGDTTVIVIEPSDPKVVYVPTYNPTVVYGTWWWPSYPPFYYYPPGYGFGAGLAAGIGFGIGIAITDSLWGGCNWHHHDVNINVNRYNNININNRLDVNKKNVSWKHNSINRGGKSYKDRKNQAKHGQKLGDSDKRQDYRGRDAERQKAAQSLKQRGIDPAKERQSLTGSGGQQVRDKVQNIDRSQHQALQRDAGKRAQGSDHKLRDSASKPSRDRSDHAFKGVNSRDGGRISSQRGSFSNRSMGGGGGHFGGGRSGGLRR
ncbi:MAG: DUF3300 domain-containing protein [bacterium]